VRIQTGQHLLTMTPFSVLHSLCWGFEHTHCAHI